VPHNCTKLWAQLTTWRVMSSRGVNPYELTITPLPSHLYHSQLTTWWVVPKIVYNYVVLALLYCVCDVHLPLTPPVVSPW